MALSSGEQPSLRYAPGDLHAQSRGFTADQAEGVTDAIAEIDLSNLVTKQDLKAELATLKADMFKALIPILLAQSALIVALIELLGSAS